MTLKRDDWQLTLDQTKGQINQTLIQLECLRAVKNTAEYQLKKYPEEKKVEKSRDTV